MSNTGIVKRWLAMALVATAPAAALAADNNRMAPKPAPTEAQMITSALSAAPAGVARHAAVVTMDAKGEMHTLRPGTNGFTCMPDNPGTPGPDPMCMDKASMDFAHALGSHTKPTPGKVGLMYMLAGGTDASNTDPSATGPTAGNHWIKTGPHLMIIGADSAFYEQFPSGADPDTTAPYVMWAGTPYQHLMAPVK